MPKPSTVRVRSEELSENLCLRGRSANLVVRFGKREACREVVITAKPRMRVPIWLLVDATFEDERLSLRFDAMKRVEGASMLGDHHDVPVRDSFGDTVQLRENSCWP